MTTTAIEPTTASSATPCKIETTIHFLRKDSIHEHEKPYAFRFDPGDDVPQSNFTLEAHSGITVRDLRSIRDEFTISKNGFAILNLPHNVPYDDYHDADLIKKSYFNQLETLLKSHLNASHVEIFRHGLRKRHKNFPVSTGNQYEYDQPTSVAHVDTTPAEVLQEVLRQHGKPSKGRRVQWINIWKPLRGPLNDWPLAVVDTSTVNPSQDFEPADLLYPDLATENAQVYFSDRYQWWYLSDHQVDELIVFVQADTGDSPLAGVPHSSFYNPFVGQNEPPRESIEARALVYYD